MEKKVGRVAVLMGGLSSEREVSIMSGTGVLKALQSRGIDAVALDPKTELKRLFTEHFDAAFNILHGRFGEDGAIQGVLEFLQIPYTGSGIRASAIAIDKVTTRTIWKDAGIPVAKGYVVHGVDEAQAVLDALGADVVVKPSSEGSSIGVTRLENADVETLQAALKEALKFDTEVLVEERVYGRELTVAIVDGEVLPVIEIKAPEGDYDYQNKYFGNAVKYDCPAKINPDVAKNLSQTVKKAFDVLNGRGWGRIDAMLREDGTFVLLELNTNPGMTPHSLVPMAARVVGMSYEDLVCRLIEKASLDHVIS